MSKKNNFFNFLSKENKSEPFVLLAISDIAVVIGLLIIFDIIELKSSKLENDLVLGIVFFALGLITMLFAVLAIIKENKLSKLLAYKEVLDLFGKEKINERFALLGLEYPVVTEHIEALNTIMMSVKITDHFDFVLTIERTSYSFCGDIDENYEYPEENEEINKVYDLGETVTIDENTNALSIFEKFYNFIVFNESVLKDLENKYGDKFEKVE